MPEHKMQKSSLDAWDEGQEDGTFGEMTEAVKDTIENNPGLTVKELLKLMTDWGNDRNKIAPKVTYLCEHGWVVRPKRRKCTVTGKMAFTHELAPHYWRDHIRALYGRKVKRSRIVKNRIETESSKDSNINHTTIQWHDDSVSCTCSDLYHRPSSILCHHAKGLNLAALNIHPGDSELRKQHEELKVMYDKLKEEHEKLRSNLEEFKQMYIK